MYPKVVRARGGVPPCGVADLSGDAPLDRDALVVAGQAMTWQWTFACGRLAAIPLTGSSAVVFTNEEGTRQDLWYDRFARGLAHRMAGELTIASVTAGLLAEGGRAAQGGDAELLGSAIEGLSEVFTDLEQERALEATAERIVADTVRTHAALLGTPTGRRVTVREDEGFTVHTVRSVYSQLGRADLERGRARIGLPWPARSAGVVGRDLGLVRWRALMQARGDQVWCRREGEHALVTELWLRSPPEPPG